MNGKPSNRVSIWTINWYELFMDALTSRIKVTTNILIDFNCHLGTVNAILISMYHFLFCPEFFNLQKGRKKKVGEKELGDC